MNSPGALFWVAKWPNGNVATLVILFFAIEFPNPLYLSVIMLFFIMLLAKVRNSSYCCSLALCIRKWPERQHSDSYLHYKNNFKPQNCLRSSEMLRIGFRVAPAIGRIRCNRIERTHCRMFHSDVCTERHLRAFKWNE